MTTQSIAAAMSASRYPGRGILVGKHPDGLHAILIYFIMGRSENSRNRVFVQEGDGIRTQAFDPALLRDPSLIIYAPVRVQGLHTIVTNGDQTDTIYEHLRAGGNFESALRTRTFEPDAPNFTPRVSALMTRTDGDCAIKMSILKSLDEGGAHACRCFFEYDSPPPGVGFFLHTYAHDGDPLPPFEGEPERVALTGSLDETARAVWANLDPQNKVSLWARSIDLTNGTLESLILNCHEGEA